MLFIYSHERAAQTLQQIQSKINKKYICLRILGTLILLSTSCPMLYLMIRDWATLANSDTDTFFSVAFLFSLCTAAGITCFLYRENEKWRYNSEVEYYTSIKGKRILQQGLYKTFGDKVSLDIVIEDANHSVTTKSIFLKPEIKTDYKDFTVDFANGVVYIPYGKENSLQWNV